MIAPMRLARLALPYMRATGQGRIVNISSIYGLTTTPLSGWYQACKHALEASSDALRLEVARDGVSVVMIEPGGIRTGIWEAFEEDIRHRGESDCGISYHRVQALLSAFSRFMGEPEGVARAVGKALTTRSPRARYLVGHDAQVIAAAQSLIPTEIRDRITRLVTGM